MAKYPAPTTYNQHSMEFLELILAELVTLNASGLATEDRTEFLQSVDKDFSDIERVVVATTAATPQDLKAANAGDLVYLMGLQATIDEAGTVTVEDTDGTDLSGAMTLATNGGFAWDPRNGPYQVTAVDKGLSLLSTTGDFHGIAQILVVTP